jgi:HSP20 family protein
LTDFYNKSYKIDDPTRYGRAREEFPMLMRTDPFRDFDRFAQQVFGTPSRPAAMPIDAFRTGDEFVVQFDLPGVDRDSIDLTVERNVLTVHAQRRREDTEGVELLIGERPQGNFSRQLFLGETLDTDRIAAEYRDGVLTLRLPITEKAKPRRVPIQGSGGPTAIDASSQQAPAEPTSSSSDQ